MKKSKLRLPILFLVFLLLLSCGEIAPVAPTPTPEPYSILQPENPLPKGERVLGITVSEGSLGFETAFAEVQKAGIDVIELNLPWDRIETGRRQYHDPWGVLGSIPFYAQYDVNVAFSIAVIDTVRRTTPAYLDGLPYDDPQMVAAFNAMIDWFLANIPVEVTVQSFSIGNEVDLFLPMEEWAAYTSFYRQTAAHLRALRPGIPLGIKNTVTHGLFNADMLTEVQTINQYTDVVMLNYYPMDATCRVLEPEIVHEHFQRIVELFPGHEIYMTEVGYQSGSQHCGSSEAKQARFYHELFKAWDRHSGQITLILIDWLHDQPPETIREWEKIYGSSDPGFLEYLSTLGLRNYDHTDKAAWRQLLVETGARGWE